MIVVKNTKHVEEMFLELSNKHGKCLEEGNVMFRNKGDDSHSIVTKPGL